MEPDHRDIQAMTASIVVDVAAAPRVKRSRPWQVDVLDSNCGQPHQPRDRMPAMVTEVVAIAVLVRLDAREL
jgi:hypothetical protein